MHRWAEKIAECVKEKVDEIGIENFSGQNLDDLKDWTEIISNIAKFDYHYKIIEAMEDAEYGEDYDENGVIPHTPLFYTEKIKGGRHIGRRMYHDDDLGDYAMNMKEYKEHSPKELRDMDRRMGRMYYTEANDMGGKSHTSRHNYMKYKMENPNAMDSSKLEEYMRDLKSDFMEMSNHMTPEEKTMAKQRLSLMSTEL